MSAAAIACCCVVFCTLLHTQCRRHARPALIQLHCTALASDVERPAAGDLCMLQWTTGGLLRGQ